MALGMELGLSLGDFVLDMGTQLPPPQKGGRSPPNLYCRYWYIQVQVLLLYAFYFLEKSLIVLSLFQYKY